MIEHAKELLMQACDLKLTMILLIALHSQVKNPKVEMNVSTTIAQIFPRICNFFYKYNLTP